MAPLNAQESFAALREELRTAGCFEYKPRRSIVSLLLHLILSVSAFVAASRLSSFLAAPCFVLGSFFFYRIGWLMHDAEHNGVFATAECNQKFGALTAGILGEFPSGWRYTHNKHHRSPNVLGQDMDQSERWDATRRYSTLAGAFAGILLLVKYKGRYLPKTLLLLGLRDGYFCFAHSRPAFLRELSASLTSMALQVFVFVWLFGAWGLLLFFVHTSIGMLYLNTAFMGNHYDLEVFEPSQADGLAFAELQTRTSRNYAGGAWARYIFGGLEHQIEHHLFPSMPRHGLRRAEPFVHRFCEENGLPYEVRPFLQCIARAIRYHTDKAR
jgi:fatty acid desaturase